MLAGIVLIGCNGRDRELEMQNAQLLSEKDSLHLAMQNRERYLDEVVSAINAVHAKLEDVRVSEEEIRMQTREGEGTIMPSTDQSRQQLLDRIEDIDNTLLESREEIARLESKVKAMGREASGLNDMIGNLKEMLEEREQKIAMLEVTITGLEGEIVDKNNLLVQRDSIIQTKDTELNTVYYIVGTRSELEEMGIISNEGGFLWGLLGSTPVLSSGVNEGAFTPLDKTRDWTIPINGEIEEIIPKRNADYYQAQSIDEHQSNLEILDPTAFWQDRYLVIVRG
jgi:hypothetical protein